MKEVEKLDLVKKATEDYLDLIMEHYPAHYIAEYTRLETALCNFLQWGYWNPCYEPEPTVLETEEDVEKFLSILFDESEPTPALKKAMERYKSLIKEGKIISEG